MKRKFWDKLVKWSEHNIEVPLMVVGARQVGKTYIIDKFCREKFNDYVYINLKDEPDIVEIFKENIATGDKVRKLELKLNRSIKEELNLFNFTPNKLPAQTIL